MTSKPTDTDVLLGRGVGTTRHPGNQNFRSVVSQHVTLYATCTKNQKMMISRSVVDKIHSDLNPPGRFLEKKAGTGLWHEVDDKRALEKTAQALRDGAAPIKKRLLDDATDPSFMDTLFDDQGKSSPKTSQDQSEISIGKKHRRAKSELPQNAKKQRASIMDVKRSSSVPAQAIKLQSSPLLSPLQQRKAAKQQELARLMQQRSGPISRRKTATSGGSMFSSKIPAEITFSRDFTSGLPGDHDRIPPKPAFRPVDDILKALEFLSPLPLRPAIEETEAAITTDDILMALEILSDSGVMLPAACPKQMAKDRAPSIDSLSLSEEALLKIDSIEDGWMHVVSDWGSSCNHIHDHR